MCLLDIEDTLYEQRILGRLKMELMGTRDLSERQNGFREGR